MRSVVSACFLVVSVATATLAAAADQETETSSSPTTASPSYGQCPSYMPPLASSTIVTNSSGVLETFLWSISPTVLVEQTPKASFPNTTGCSQVGNGQAFVTQFVNAEDKTAGGCHFYSASRLEYTDGEEEKVVNGGIVTKTGCLYQFTVSNQHTGAVEKVLNFNIDCNANAVAGIHMEPIADVTKGATVGKHANVDVFEFYGLINSACSFGPNPTIPPTTVTTAAPSESTTTSISTTTTAYTSSTTTSPNPDPTPRGVCPAAAGSILPFSAFVSEVYPNGEVETNIWSISPLQPVSITPPATESCAEEGYASQYKSKGSCLTNAKYEVAPPTPTVDGCFYSFSDSNALTRVEGKKKVVKVDIRCDPSVWYVLAVDDTARITEDEDSFTYTFTARTAAVCPPTEPSTTNNITTETETTISSTATSSYTSSSVAPDTTTTAPPTTTVTATTSAAPQPTTTRGPVVGVCPTGHDAVTGFAFSGFVVEHFNDVKSTHKWSITPSALVVPPTPTRNGTTPCSEPAYASQHVSAEDTEDDDNGGCIAQLSHYYGEPTPQPYGGCDYVLGDDSVVPTRVVELSIRCDLQASLFLAIDENVTVTQKNGGVYVYSFTGASSKVCPADDNPTTTTATYSTSSSTSATTTTTSTSTTNTLTGTTDSPTTASPTTPIPTTAPSASGICPPHLPVFEGPASLRFNDRLSEYLWTISPTAVVDKAPQNTTPCEAPAFVSQYTPAPNGSCSQLFAKWAAFTRPTPTATGCIYVFATQDDKVLVNLAVNCNPHGPSDALFVDSIANVTVNSVLGFTQYAFSATSPLTCGGQPTTTTMTTTATTGGPVTTSSVAPTTSTPFPSSSASSSTTTSTTPSTSEDTSPSTTTPTTSGTTDLTNVTTDESNPTSTSTTNVVTTTPTATATATSTAATTTEEETSSSFSTTTTSTAAPTQQPTDAPAVVPTDAKFTTSITGYKLVIEIIDFVSSSSSSIRKELPPPAARARGQNIYNNKAEDEEIYLVDCVPIKDGEDAGNSSCTVAFVKKDEAQLAVEGANEGKLAGVTKAEVLPPRPTNAPTNSPADDDNKGNTGLVIGVVAGCAAAIAAIVGGLLYYRRRRRSAEGEYERFRDVDSEIRSNIN